MPDDACHHRSSFRLPTTAFVALVVVMLAFAFQGTRGLWEPDEGRYVAVALEMLRTGDWLHPQLHHEVPHYTKPPMTYWLIASSMACFGQNEWAARLPGAVAFALGALCVGLIARRISPGRGSAAAVIYATSALPFIAANIVTTDTPLSLFELAGMLGFVYAWIVPSGQASMTSDHPRRGAFLLLMWSAFGLAFLTKGPPALLPLTAIVVVVARTDGWRGIGRLLNPLGLTAFFAIGLSWYAAVIVQSPELARYFLVDEVVNRVASDTHNRNSAWYMALMYVPVIVAGLLPWSADWLRPSSWRGVGERLRHPQTLFLALWIALPLVVFMLAKSRMPLYVLPIVAPLVLLTCRRQAVDWLDQARARRFVAGAMVMLIAARIGLAMLPSDKDARAAASLIRFNADSVEVVYIDMTPQYGVSLYAGRSIEVVTAIQDPGKVTLDDELSEAEGQLTFVFTNNEHTQVTDSLSRHHWLMLSEDHQGSICVITATPPRRTASVL